MNAMSSNAPGIIPTKIISARPEPIGQYANPFKMGQNLWMYRELIVQFTKRQVLQRYKGSYLGLVWSFASPLALLAVYTFAFSVIFKVRWAETATGSHAEFALTLFAGLIAFNVFSESVLAAPNLIVDNPNYVKKVVFPLEILPISGLGTALIQSLFSLLVLLLGTLFIMGQIPWTLLLLPLMYLPLILLCLGLGWFLATLGPVIPDIEHLLRVVVQILFFLTPIFYPISAIPANFRFFLYLNPLTLIVTQFRQVILFGQLPNWIGFLAVTAGTLVVCMLGYVWFIKIKRIIADIV